MSTETDINMNEYSWRCSSVIDYFPIVWIVRSCIPSLVPPQIKREKERQKDRQRYTSACVYVYVTQKYQYFYTYIYKEKKQRELLKTYQPNLKLKK